MKDPRRLAVTLVGFCAFLQLYTPQSLLPTFAAEFGAGPAAVAALVSATTLAVAFAAPFAGAIADRFGRRRIIVGSLFALVFPTIMLALGGSLEELVFWRFVQGILLPPVFTVAVAYIGEEWPAKEVPSVVALYIAGSALGGFLGRFLSGVIADHFGWRAAFGALAVIDLAGALVVLRYLPRESKFVAASGLAASFRAMGRHIRTPRLVVTFAAGFAILFAFVSTFTYVNFHLAAEPYHLSPGALGAIFVVYLLGVVVTPLSGRPVIRYGRRAVALASIALWIAATALTLVPSLPAIIAGLALGAAAGFIIAALANGFLATAATEGKSAAVGLFALFYYVGGTAGGLLPAVAFTAFGWNGVVAMVIVTLALLGVAVAWAWSEVKKEG